MLVVRLSSLFLISATFLGCAPPGTDSSTAKNEPPEIIAQKAQVGVGKQGQSLANHSDTQKILSGPVKALTDFKQKAVFDLQVAPAIRLFEASNGRKPKTHQEFMEQIIEANRITLPELPEGAVYRYVPEKGELWVFPEDEAPQ